MNWSYVNGFFNTMVSNAKYDISQGNNLTIITEDISKYNGRRVIKDNKVFRLQIGQGTPITFDKYYTGEASVANDYLNSLYYEFRTNWFLQRNTDNPGKKKIKITLAYQQYTITAIEEPDASTLSYTLPVSANRATCSDAMYDMFCMPVSPKVFGLESEDTNVVIVYEEDLYSTQEYIFLDTETTSAGHLALAELLATELGAGTAAGEIYDLQLLPFCPITELDPYFENHAYGPTYGKIVFDLNTIPSNMYTIIKNNSNQACGVVFYPNKANFSTWVDFSSPGETVHEEWLKIEKPVLTAQGRQGDLTRWAFFSFPYKVTDGTWDIGPNLNNSNVDVELSDGLTNEDCEYINLYVSSGLEAPFLSIASEDLPLQPANDYSTTITGDFTIRVLAHWIMPDSALDKKIKNECDFYRLTSPNYNSFYEFKKTKLYGGNIEKLITVCTYKPISPYIKINPDLNGSLYSDKWYNDNIGLMLAGDYSIPMMSDAMINYELQNRNYQAIFNRQIQNLDVNQQIAKEQQQFQGIVGAITAPLTGGLAGAATGAKAGPYGAIAGAVVGVGAGAALGGVGYAKDMEWLQQQQAEARDFAIDQFNYQLGNIQALPQSMTKSTPLSFHNKVWPIIEYFSCTDREKDVLRNKLKYDGMTIMAIGSLNDYSDVGGYLKGKMIRLNNLGDDSHVANAIYEEVNKGFYEGE